MINEIKEFESYVMSPESESPRIQPKMFTNDFDSQGSLYDLDHILTMIARGFLFGDFFDKDKNIFSDKGMISETALNSTKRILFDWLGFVCRENDTNDTAESEEVGKWRKKYPEAQGWLKKYYWKQNSKANDAKADKKKKTEEQWEKCWKEIEDKWTASLQDGELDYRFKVMSMNDIIANALEQGELKEWYLIIKKDPDGEKTTKGTKKFKNRFQYLYELDEKAGKIQEKSVVRLLKNIAAYLYLRKNHPENQEYVLLDRIQLLCWYGLDDNKNSTQNWYLTQFLVRNGEEKQPIMTKLSSEMGWNFIKLKINQDFLEANDIKLVTAEEEKAIDQDQYWVIKDNGHGEASLVCSNDN